ncbi:MAG TPA: ATP-binding protein, partial [Dehalococcoidia bacterium]|nr:ATP-binding protein [Dehalococcoidia bacterium]
FLRSIVRAHKLAKRAPDLRFTAPSDDPIVRADVVRLQQVIDNLIDNAVKYAGHAGPISVRLTSKSGAAWVSVADKGPGVPGDALESIFLPFVRLKATPGAGGSGLGLAVCKGIIEAHGGRIWAENIRRGGFRVSFTLPLAESAPS